MKFRESLVFAMAVISLCSITFASGQTSADYAIPSDVFANCGGTSSSPDYTIGASLGQPATIGISQGTDYELSAGFWARVAPALCVHHGDVDFNGAHTAGDAQMAFQIALGIIIPSYSEECAADCNGDGSVTAGDAQQIFGAVFGGSCSDPLPARAKNRVIRTLEETTDASGESDGENIIRLEQSDGAAGDEIRVDVVIANASIAVDAFTIEIQYDSERLQLTRWLEGPIFSNWIEFDCREVSPGKLVIAGYAVDDGIPVGSYDSLVELTFSDTGISASDSSPEISLGFMADDLAGFFLD